MNLKTIAVYLSLLPASAAWAQFFPGFVNLPQNDFKWVWGTEKDLENRRGSTDFSVVGFEASFRCDLTGRFSASSNYSMSEIRAFEDQLRNGSGFFIQNAAVTMNNLELNRQLRWAELDCAKPEPTDADEAALKAKEDKARERAERARERRRARDED